MFRVFRVYSRSSAAEAFFWKGGILAIIDLRHGATEHKHPFPRVATDRTRNTGRQAPDARSTRLVCDGSETETCLVQRYLRLKSPL